jgi:tetratricopeptide (TPR) repeat protein
MAVFAAEDAIGYYERARDLLSSLDARHDWEASSPTPGLEHLHVNLGRAHELAGEWEEAEKTYEEMLAGARDPRLECAALNHLAILARWDGDTERALARLREAEILAVEIGLAGELWQIRAALGELHEERGDEERARDAFASATETLRSLAGRIDDPTLQASFLGAPQVRHVLER